MRNVLYSSEDKPQDQLISDSIVWNLEAAKIQVEVCVFGNYVKKLMAYINVRPAFFYAEAFVYNSVAIRLIMTKLLHHTV